MTISVRLTAALSSSLQARPRPGLSLSLSLSLSLVSPSWWVTLRLMSEI